MSDNLINWPDIISVIILKYTIFYPFLLLLLFFTGIYSLVNIFIYYGFIQLVFPVIATTLGYFLTNFFSIFVLYCFFDFLFISYKQNVPELLVTSVVYEGETNNLVLGLKSIISNFLTTNIVFLAINFVFLIFDIFEGFKPQTYSSPYYIILAINLMIIILFATLDYRVRSKTNGQSSLLNKMLKLKYKSKARNFDPII